MPPAPLPLWAPLGPGHQHSCCHPGPCSREWSGSAPDCLVAESREQPFSESGRPVLVHASRPSTQLSCSYQWKTTSTTCSLSLVLEYLLPSVSCVKAHLATIAAFSAPGEGKSLFSHEASKRFFKGLNNLYLPLTHLPLITSLWATCPLDNLSFKVSVLSGCYISWERRRDYSP